MKKLIAVLLCLCMALCACAAPAPEAEAKPTAAPTAEPTVAPTAEPAPEPTAAPAAEAPLYTAGTYTGTGIGRGGELSVSVVFADDAISEVTVAAHAETPYISDPALERIPAAIVANQSLGVDVVAGATLTSVAVINAVADAVEQAGGDSAALRSVAVAAPVGTEKALTADVVIVGGGFGGICSAIALYEAGVENVLLIERQGRLGGEAYASGGFVQGAEAQAFIDRGMTGDTADAFYEYMIHITEGKAYPELQRKVADMSGESITWLENHGVVFAPYVLAQGETSVARGLVSPDHTGTGIVNPMLASLYETGVTVMMDTTATELLQDESGRITGVVAVDAMTGDTLTIDAGAVVLATGTTVEGRELAQAAGADFLVHSDGGPDGTIFANYGLYVNAAGQRYTNESGYYARIYQELYDCGLGLDTFMIMSVDYAQNDPTMYYQADHMPYTMMQMLDNARDPDFRYVEPSGELIDAGATYEGETLEEALAAAGLPVEDTLATIARYNELCAKGVDEDFGKPAANMIAIPETGPYYVWRVPISSSDQPDPMGYPMTDLQCRILRADGTAIEGLYGAGTVFTNHFRYRMYPGSGINLQFCTSMGRIVGTEVPAYLAQN